jgi:hypothetical protein
MRLFRGSDKKKRAVMIGADVLLPTEFEICGWADAFGYSIHRHYCKRIWFGAVAKGVGVRRGEVFRLCSYYCMSMSCRNRMQACGWTGQSAEVLERGSLYANPICVARSIGKMRFW